MRFIGWRELIGEDFNKFTRCRLSKDEVNIVVQALEFSDRHLRESMDRAERMADLLPSWVSLEEGLELTDRICMQSLNREFEGEIEKLFINVRPRRKKHVRKIAKNLIELKSKRLADVTMKNLALTEINYPKFHLITL